MYAFAQSARHVCSCLSTPPFFRAQELDTVHREIALSHMIQQMPERWGVLGRWLCSHMPPPATVDSLVAVIGDDRVSASDTIRLLLSVFKSKKIVTNLVGQTNILRELFAHAGEAGEGMWLLLCD